MVDGGSCGARPTPSPACSPSIVPRHAARGAEIAALLRERGHTVARRAAGEAPGAGDAFYVADTMGELGLFYRLAPVAFIGGSLVPHGGPEPAGAGAARLRHRARSAHDQLSRDRGGAGGGGGDGPGRRCRDARRCRPRAARRLRPARRAAPSRGARRRRPRARARRDLGRARAPARSGKRRPAVRRPAMRAPEFWRHDGALPALLAPAAGGWMLATRLRRALAHPYCAAVPVICVGNLVAGGAGKTPVVHRRWRAASPRCDRRPHIVTRGYGGGEAGPLRVDPARHDARAVGDEALLLARVAPTWVARDRVAGARCGRGERRRGDRARRRAAEPDPRQGSVAGGRRWRVRVRQRPGDPGGPAARAVGVGSRPRRRGGAGRARHLRRAGDGGRARAASAARPPRSGRGRGRDRRKARGGVRRDRPAGQVLRHPRRARLPRRRRRAVSRPSPLCARRDHAAGGPGAPPRRDAGDDGQGCGAPGARSRAPWSRCWRSKSRGSSRMPSRRC